MSLASSGHWHASSLRCSPTHPNHASQVSVILVAAAKLAKDLPFCLFVQTFVFVAFNKVVTAQVRPSHDQSTDRVTVFRVVCISPASFAALDPDRIQMARCSADYEFLRC